MKPKKQSSDTALLAVIFIPLAGFFVFAAFGQPRCFLFIAPGLLGVILYLIPISRRLSEKKAESQLKIQDLQEQRNLLEAEIHREEEAIDAFRGKIVSYAQLKGLTEKLGLCLSLEDTSRTLSTEVNQLFGNRETIIILYLFHSKTGELGLSASQKGQMQVNIKSKKGDIFDQWVVKTMQPLFIEDTKSDYRFDADRIVTEDARVIRSLISVPLLVGSRALGILRIDSHQQNNFRMEDLRFLMTIGDLGAVAIENAQLYEHVEQLAITDALTGLYLRRYMLERLGEELGRQLRNKGQLSLLMIDLDHFKQYNDRFGHTAGDIILRTLGMMLIDSFKDPGMLVCRYGGEEFVVALPDCPRARAMEAAEAFRKKVESQAILLRREKTSMTVSIGVAVFPKDAQMKEELIHKADQALYRAKEGGRNKVFGA